MSFTWDVFISYARRDQAWAERVSEALTAKGFQTYLDKPQLLAGVDWRSELSDALEGSQHLVVLWSDAAISDWVVYEITLFQASLRLTAGGQGAGAPRRIIPIYLQGEYIPLAMYQHIDAIRQAGVYRQGPAALSAAEWQEIAGALEASIRQADAARGMPVLLVTTTRAALDRIDPDQPLPPPPLVGESLGTLIGRLGFCSRDELLDSYGSDRHDWRPFRSTSSVKGILEQVKDDINLQLSSEGLRRFRWEYLDDEFWSASPERVAERLKREPTVVVLDPLALYDPHVMWMTTTYLIPNIRENARAVVVVLPPFAMSTTATALRGSIQGLALEVFNGFYNPPVLSGARHARYVTGVADEVDLKAWLLAGIGPALARNVQAGGHVYIDT